MRLTYFFQTKQDAEAFFLKAVQLYTGDVEGIEIDGEEFSIIPSELSELCVMCSWTSDEDGIYVFLDFDGDSMKIADQIKGLIDKIVAPANVSYCNWQVGKRLGVIVDDKESDLLKLSWPEVWEPLPELSDDYKYSYHIYALLPSSSKEYMGKCLSSQQQVKLLKHWLDFGGLQINDLDMYSWSDGGDGNYTPGSLENIVTAIYGNGMEQCGYIRIANSWGNETDKELYIKRLILDLLVQDVEISDIGDIGYVGAGNGLKIVSDGGVDLQVNLNRKLLEKEQAAFVERYMGSDIYKFVDAAFVHLFGVPPVLLVVHEVHDETTSFEDADELEGYVMTLTNALKDGNYKISAVKANKELEKIGVLKEMKVRGVKSPKKAFSDENSPFGVNIPKSHRKNDIEARETLNNSPNQS
ncbi:hypothetical protein BTA51_26825 [Hahella sp. CCB-MM4]|uniref:hypothetical protein n=1 Tax=Hahella sp. (strain CCB-MM4) TaxID=1926491 RepID=UPI000B9C3DDD|nr:hypothetical protein [Hahella sp. CCB-MM4]OZG70332.1 hypothetical protein BTA51_26825 [Hahella sp. CCB-MM4]